MFKPVALIILSTIPQQKIEQVFIFDSDYSEVAREYYKQDNTTFDPNDFMYKLLIKEMEEKPID